MNFPFKKHIYRPLKGTHPKKKKINLRLLKKQLRLKKKKLSIIKLRAFKVRYYKQGLSNYYNYITKQLKRKQFLTYKYLYKKDKRFLKNISKVTKMNKVS